MWVNKIQWQCHDGKILYENLVLWLFLVPFKVRSIPNSRFQKSRSRHRHQENQLNNWIFKFQNLPNLQNLRTTQSNFSQELSVQMTRMDIIIRARHTWKHLERILWKLFPMWIDHWWSLACFHDQVHVWSNMTWGLEKSGILWFGHWSPSLAYYDLATC